MVECHLGHSRTQEIHQKQVNNIVSVDQLSVGFVKKIVVCPKKLKPKMFVCQGGRISQSQLKVGPILRMKKTTMGKMQKFSISEGHANRILANRRAC